MSTTTNVIPFIASTTNLFQFQPTFDNQTYTCIVPWNAFAQRYYVVCYTLSGDLVFNVPLIGSPPNSNISITAGYFTTQLIFRKWSNQFEIIQP